MEGTNVTEVYEAFLAKIEQDEWQNVNDLIDAEKDWFQLLKIAIFRFKFPRISLELIKTTPLTPLTPSDISLEPSEPKEIITFAKTLTQGEIQVLATYMKDEWLKRQLASWQLMKQRFSTKDFEIFSPANLMAKIQASIELSKIECVNIINVYCRSIDGKPFDYSRWAGSK